MEGPLSDETPLVGVAERLTVNRVRLIALGAVIGLTWAASLRAFMMVLAGPDSTFTFSGTFGIIIPTGIIVGALLGWAEHQRRVGTPHPLLILAPLLIGVAGDGPAPFGLALIAMVGGYAVSGRGPLWTRIVAGTVNLAAIPVTFLAPKPHPNLSATTAQGAWFATLASCLGLTLALACSIPMRRPDPNPAGQTSAAARPDRRPATATSVVDKPAVHDHRH